VGVKDLDGIVILSPGVGVSIFSKITAFQDVR
jgi:hypothetical protein